VTRGTVFLMYHELERAGRDLVDNDPGYVRYVLGEEDFRAHVALMRETSLRGVSVGDALAARDDEAGRSVCITFDDGCESDYLCAAPILSDAGFNATFYVVSGFVGRRGYVTDGQLRELSDAGFEIGSHSDTHAYLDDIGEADLREEIAGSKSKLEDLTGKRVEHFSCPGGRWTRRAAEVARGAGYLSVATSSPGVNTASTDPFSLRRVKVMRGTGAREFGRLSRAEGLLRRRAQEAALAAAKRLLGNTVYEKVRGAVLD
jgi:peptidoglycan/xylan/chitin deacetylase (PgdA/CDA1 family)